MPSPHEHAKDDSVIAPLHFGYFASEASMKPVLIASILAILLLAAAESRAQQPSNYTDALLWYERAAEAGDATAQFLLGRMAEDGHNRPRDAGIAAEWYRKAAEQGHRLAQFSLGVMHYEGRGVPKDAKAAAHWYAKAAAQGMPEAQFNLGYFAEHGIGIPRDLKKARAWYEKAAEQGLGRAQLNLGLLLMAGTAQGRFDPDALTAAYYWLSRAAAGKTPGAAAARDDLAARMTPELLARAQARVAAETTR